LGSWKTVRALLLVAISLFGRELGAGGMVNPDGRGWISAAGLLPLTYQQDRHAYTYDLGDGNGPGLLLSDRRFSYADGSVVAAWPLTHTVSLRLGYRLEHLDMPEESTFKGAPYGQSQWLESTGPSVGFSIYLGGLDAQPFKALADENPDGRLFWPTVSFDYQFAALRFAMTDRRDPGDHIEFEGRESVILVEALVPVWRHMTLWYRREEAQNWVQDRVTYGPTADLGSGTSYGFENVRDLTSGGNRDMAGMRL
jgi:hypothetical protein